MDNTQLTDEEIYNFSKKIRSAIKNGGSLINIIKELEQYVVDKNVVELEDTVIK